MDYKYCKYNIQGEFSCNVKKKFTNNNIKPIPFDKNNMIKLNEKETLKWQKLFNLAIKFYNNNNIKVDINIYDLFHCHICNDKSIIFHAREYPRDFPYYLGKFQDNSNINMKDFDKRNLKLVLKDGKYEGEVVEHTENLFYKECDNKQLYEIYIDPYTKEIYKLIT